MAAEVPFDVFVSYSTKDGLIAEALAKRLKHEGIRYWWAPESLKPGTNYQHAIAQDIPRCRLMLVLLSDKANYSHHVERELLLAMEEGKPILPVRIEPVEPSTQLRYALTGPHRMDAFPPFRKHLDSIAGTLRTWLETLRREAPVVRVLEPVDKFSAAKGAPLRVSFEVLLGTERRLKRARLEIRRDGVLLHHRTLAESEIHDRGGMHHVEWVLPASLADGGHFQLAVLAGDTNGQEGSAQMEGSFAVNVAAAPPAEPAPAPVPAPALVSPALTTPPAAAPAKNSRGVKVAENAFNAIFSVGGWAFRLVWMLALTGAVASVAHTIVEPHTATREYHTYYVPPAVVVPDTITPPGSDGLLFQKKSGSMANEAVKSKPADPQPDAQGAPPPPPPTFQNFSDHILRQATPAPGQPGLSRFNPEPYKNMRVIEGPRIPGRPLKALWSTVQSPAKIGTHFHAAIPPEEGEKIGIPGAFWQGGVLGAMLGLVAGVIAGLLAVGSAAVQRLPLDMMPLGENEAFWKDFGIVAAVAALTIFDTGAVQPGSGHWSTPLFWWVAGLTVVCFLGGTTVKAALNHRRQAAMLG